MLELPTGVTGNGTESDERAIVVSALRLPVVGSSPEIDFASCLPVALEPGAWVGSESDANSGTDDSGPGIGGADGGGWGDVLPPLSVACGGGDISASCGEVMLLALSDLTMPPVELDRCTVAVMPAEPVIGGPLFSCTMVVAYKSLKWPAYSPKNGCVVSWSSVGSDDLQASFDRIDSSKDSANEK
uniref:Uncharacterized protein n=1 Tax=Anopheles melas TaxID=34690 RepID=A0A182TE13_9DIPT